MAATPSTLLALGTVMPEFELPDFDGRWISSSKSGVAPGTLVMFLCPHCPFVRHTRMEIGRVGRDFQARGLAVYGINPSDTDAFGSPAMNRTVFELYCAVFCLGAAGDPDKTFDFFESIL